MLVSLREQAREDKALLGPDLFLEVQKILFRQIFDHTFVDLKSNHCERSVSQSAAAAAAAATAAAQGIERMNPHPGML